MIKAAAAISFLLLAAQTLLAQASLQLTPVEILARVLPEESRARR